MLESLKIEFGTNKIFVYLPQRMMFTFAGRQYCLDFAFEIHTDLGANAKSASK